jgi:hypothetical protein
MIRIKNDVFDEQQIVVVTFNEHDKDIFLHLKGGALLIYGKEYKPGQIPKDRVITEAEYEKIKDYFLITKKCEVVA